VISDKKSNAVLSAEAMRWAARRDANPYDRAAREGLGRVLLQLHGERFPPGTAGRGQLLLGIMANAFPIPAVCRAYLDNLQGLLAVRTERVVPGRVVLGLGTGRCGSTSLTGLIAGVADACATHENPPLIYWQPLAVQLDFHLRRFELLVRRFALVFDSAHWWLGAVDPFFDRFPTGAIIGLYRDAEACARSFMQIKGAGPGTINHWAPHRSAHGSQMPGIPSIPAIPCPRARPATPTW